MVEVIAPSTPVLDDYFTTYVVARRGGAPDSGFRGEVWLWTDKTYIRPYHLNFTAADRGVIKVPLKFQGPPLQRVETYQLGPASSISAWGNPVLPVAPGAPRLLWGALEKCDQPGLDFCLSESGQPPALPGAAAIGVQVVWKQAFGQRLGFIFNPKYTAADDVCVGFRRVLPGQDDRELKRSMQDVPSCFLMISAEVSSGNILSNFLTIDRKTMQSGPAAAKKYQYPMNLLPTDSGLIGVWVDEPTAAGLYASLQRNRSYASWGGRVLIAPDGQGRALLAGYGPRLEVKILGAAPAALATDDYHLTVTLPARDFRLTATDGTRLAVALDRLFAP